MRLAVDGDAVPHRVLHDQHTDFLQLFAQLLDIEGHDAVFDVDAGAVVEHIQRAVNVDFQSCCDVLCLLFLLRQQRIVQILQNRHVFRHGVSQIIPVDHADTAVDDGLFHRLQALLAAYDQLAQGEDEVGFQRQRILIVAVVQVQVHGVDVVA